MIDINGFEISKAFTGGMPVNAIYSNGVKVWPVGVNWGGLCFTALEDSEINMTHYGTNETTYKPKLSYSKDCVNWVEWDYTPISVVTGDNVYFKGVNNLISRSSSNYSTFTMTGSISASGNIMSLLYGDDYEGQVSLSGKGYCYFRLFYGCTSLTTAPTLPATTLGGNCYQYMFYGCTSLTTAPELPATTLANNCYQNMFQVCTSLTTAPELPATTLANNCYQNMFQGCTSLTIAPELPATTLYNNCYTSMFRGCTSLTTAPSILPATTLANNCYQNMFYGCTSLTTAPALPATTLATNCYGYMFYRCSNINYVKADFTTTPSTTYTNNWLSGVAKQGTFVANPSATWPSEITRGASTVPSGWVIE